MRTGIATLLVVICLALVWPAHAQPPPDQAVGAGVFAGLGKATVAVSYSVPLTAAPSPALYLDLLWVGDRGGAGLATPVSTVIKPVAGWIGLSLDPALLAITDRVLVGGAVLTDNLSKLDAGGYWRLSLASWDF